jgi:hypothetical protein
VVVASPARADLADDTRALLTSWRRAGASVERAGTVFLLSGEARSVALPRARRGAPRCLRVVALAERAIGFAVAPGTVAPGALATNLEALSGIGFQPSEAGVAQLENCSRSAKSLRRITVTMAAGRGAIEIIVMRYDDEPPAVDRVLPERAIGFSAPRSEIAPLALAPLRERLERSHQLAKNDAAAAVVDIRTRATSQGAGSMVMRLSGGCHRVSVLSETQGQGVVDVDAEARLAQSHLVLARDRSHAPDGRLDFCVADSERVELRFVGAASSSSVVVVDAHWPLPSGLPHHWGRQASAGLAWALFRRRTPAVSHAPNLLVMGPVGTTVVPLTVEPGACYLVALTLARGEALGGRLSVHVAGETRYDDAGDEPRSAALTFCAPPGVDRAELEVDLRGGSAWWGAALWRLGASTS